MLVFACLREQVLIHFQPPLCPALLRTERKPALYLRFPFQLMNPTVTDPILAHHLRAIKFVEESLRPKRSDESLCRCGDLKSWDHAEKRWDCLSCGGDGTINCDASPTGRDQAAAHVKTDFDPETTKLWEELNEHRPFHGFADRLPEPY